MIFYFATFLFFVCTITTLTSVREEPLISASLTSSSSRDNGDIGNSNDDDDDQPEIEGDESRPLLPLRRHSSRTSYNAANKSTRTAANPYFTTLNNQEGFVEIDPATGRTIPHDHVEGTGPNILLQTLERSHQVVAASMSNADPSNPTPVPTQAFEAELIQKAKLIKLGIQSFFIFLL